ncbi:hypothetical protein SDC9_106030 [bioreactor metagenome]|uniref:NodB homology domain-containing protein n=1 Tax=bioreactor metagenome TaxID=1076179 RepID=A0A645B164_9ZZZZ
MTNGNFATVSNWSGSNSILTISNNEMIITGNGTSVSPTANHSDSMTIKGGERYYFHAKMMVTNSDCQQIRVRTCGDYGSFIINNPIANKWYDVYGLCKIPDAVTETVAYKLFARHTYIDATTSNNKSCKVKEVMMISLNNDFGLGVNPPEHLIKRLFERNGYWEGTQNIIVKNSEDQLPYLEKANKGYVIDNPVAHQSRSRKPIISFQCDDGYYEDYLKLHKFSDKYGVPFTSAIYKNSTMPISTMLYLQDVLGWEFNSHTYDHVVLANLATEAEIEHQMKTSKEYMESLGLSCNTIIYPEGSNDERVRRIGKKYFSCGATTNTGINTGVVPSFYLKRVGLGSFQSTPTYDFYKSKVDEAIATNGWLIFMLHPSAPAHDEAQQLIIDQLIQYIIAQGIEVKTLIDGYEDFGNAIEIGDYIGGTEGIAISKNGERKNI